MGLGFSGPIVIFGLSYINQNKKRGKKKRVYKERRKESPKKIVADHIENIIFIHSCVDYCWSSRDIFSNKERGFVLLMRKIRFHCSMMIYGNY